MILKMVARLSIVKAMIVLTLGGFLAVFLYAGVNITAGLTELRNIRGDSSVAQIAKAISELTHEMQKERGASAGFIASGGAEFGDVLARQRAESDKKIIGFREAANDLSVLGFTNTQISDVLGGLDNISDLRIRVDELNIELSAAVSEITTLNRNAIDILPELASEISGGDAARAVQRHAIFMLGKDILGLERATGSAGFARASGELTDFPAPILKRLQDLTTQRETLFNIYELLASPAMGTGLGEANSSEEALEVQRLAQIAASGNLAEIQSVGGVTWFDAVTALMGPFKQLDDAGTAELLHFIDEQAAQARSHIRSDLIKLGTIVLVLGMISGALVIFSVRAIKKVSQRVADLADGDIKSPIEIATQSDLAKITLALRKFQAAELASQEELEHQKGLEESSVAGIKRIVENVKANDFGSRLRLRDLTGASEILGAGINEILQTAEETVGEQRERDLAALEEERNSKLAQDKAIQALNEVVHACSNGNFRERMETSGLDGVWQDVGEGINQIASTCETSLGEIRHIMVSVADGDLNGRMQGDYHGTFSDISEATNVSLEKLHDAFFRISGGAESIEQTAVQVDMGTSDLTKSSENQVAAVDTSVDATDRLKKTLNENTRQLGQCRALIGRLDAKTTEGQDVAEKAVATMSNIEEASGEMSEIVATIDDIAFQTNLLALNASVEAARAGDAGKGFAVVASEVRSLAGRCADASSQIGGLITQSVSQIKAGASNVRSTGDAIDEIRQTMGEVLEMIDALADAGVSQAEGVTALGASMSELDSSAKSNLSLAKRNSELTDQLLRLKSELTKTVSTFLGDGMNEAA